MPRRPRLPCVAVGIVERYDHHFLIARSKDIAEREWLFPRGPVQSGESPEAAMRRIAMDDLGISIEVVVGQPPIVEQVDGENVEARYFFCGIIDGEPQPGPYAEVRWVSKAHLLEYDFDFATAPIVEWMSQR